MARADYSRIRHRGTQRSEYVKHNSGPDVTLTGLTILRDSDKAILVQMEDGKELWLPLSQVKEIHRTKEKGADSVVISDWIAKQKGFI